MLKKRGCLLVGVTNTVGSTISRETDCGIHCNAGQEIGVASTKTFSAQFTVLVLFALLLSEGRFSKRKRYTEILQNLKKLPAQIQETLALEEQCKEIAKLWKDKTSVLMMARGYNFANVLEGALKLKEVANLFAEGILTGELKHGPLALVEHDLPMLMIQVTARGGKPVIICDRHLKPKLEKFSDHLLLLPETTDCLKGLLSVVPLQLLAYHVATLRGHNVDFPRALAKSLAVE
ncbi:Oidioi.mRNA.OKI2018_I69.chr2.g6286.t1.cds [Oikopleura dioica]|uniref:Oidioi.mRNA.OKI2018_I69.chr2.g6286.t1.cds n=1 Tax=Oikopleura dioica TaxID=34765 RepID=A0ABN7T7A4_OIKDI|nr:Oidioi.mRNA.OKI2018_I69.chr2.g6286.t1.cds [Oikopleura dioica]